MARVKELEAGSGWAHSRINRHQSRTAGQDRLLAPVNQSRADWLGYWMTEHTPEDWAEWEEFYDDYTQGKVGKATPPTLPAIIKKLQANKDKDQLTQVCDLSVPHPTNPKELFEFYERYGFLPAPIPVNEVERVEVLDLYKVGLRGRIKELNELAQLASDVFDDGAIALVSAVLPHSLTLMGVGADSSGLDWDGVVRLTPTQVQTCRHNMLGDSDDNLVFANRSLDWRIKDSPMFSPDGGDMGLIVSSRITLPGLNGKEYPIGNFCVLRSGADPKPWTQRDSDLLTRFARRARAEILNAHDRLHLQPRRALQTEFVGSFIQRDLGSSSKAAKMRHSPAPGAFSPKLGGDPDEASARARTFDRPIERAAEVVKASSCALLDLRELAKASAFKLDGISRGSTRKSAPASASAPAPAPAPAPRPALVDTIGWQSFASSSTQPQATPTPLKSIEVLGMTAAGCRDGFEAALRQQEFLRPVQRALAVVTAHGHNTSDVLAQAFAPVLPASRQSTVVIPVFDHSGVPALVLIVTSDERQAFDAGDRNFVERVGHLCLAALVKDQALASERAKLAFVAKISHELRAPMLGLAGQIGHIREAYANSSATAEQGQKLEPMLKVADLCLSSLQSICDDSLVFAKLSNEAESQTGEETRLSQAEDEKMAVTDVAGLCSNVAKSVWVRKMKQSSATRTDGQGDEMDAGTVEVILDFKPQQNGWLASVNASNLRRVIANVLTNAYTFTENGWVRLTMDTEPTVDEHGRRSLEITVSDSGKGIPRSFLQSGDIWLPFRQADSFSRGSGLGLSIVRELLNRMGGAISITSELGQGTTVVISVPLAFEQAEPAPAEVQVLSDELNVLQQATKTGAGAGLGRSPAPSRAPSPSRPPPGAEAEAGAGEPPPKRPPSSTSHLPASRPLNILVAEDNAVSRNILARLFTKKGYHFHAVEDGQKAVDVFAERGDEFDIFLTDVQMPIKDGIEASFDIRKLEKANGWPRRRIVALSGLSNPEDVALALDNDGPIDAWLIKGGSSLQEVTAELARLQRDLKRQ